MWKDTLRKAPFSGKERAKQYQDRDANYRQKLKDDFPRVLENVFDEVYDKALSKNPNSSFYNLSIPSSLNNYIQDMYRAGIQNYEIAQILADEYDAQKVSFSLDDGAYGVMVITK